MHEDLERLLANWEQRRDGGPVATVALDVRLFGRAAKADLALPAVLRAWDRFRDRHGSTIRWGNRGTGRWSRWSEQMWSCLDSCFAPMIECGLPPRRRRGRPKLPRIVTFSLHSGETYAHPTPPAIEIWLVASDPDSLTLRWVLPPAGGAEDLVQITLELVADFPLRWGWAGPTVFSPDTEGDTGGCHETIGDAFLTNPMLSPDEVNDFFRPKPSHLSWITVLGPSLLKRLGSITRCTAALRAQGFQVETAGGSLAALPSARPLMDGSVRARQAWLWSWLQPVRAAARDLDRLWIPGLTPLEAGAWARRWE